jgi:hypothetical protein
VTALSRAELVVLTVVRDSAGRWDTRNLDYQYHGRSQELLEPNILHVLRDLESRGYVEEVAIHGGTGPGRVPTAQGYAALTKSA